MSAKLRRRAAPVTLVSLVALLSFAVVALLGLSGAEAAGQGQPKCGETITADTTLQNDLVDCPNNGIVIGADGVTLDLNSHTVDGDGTEFSACNPQKEVCDTGVADDGHDGITVMDGQVREFGVGVLFGTSSAGKVRHNRVLGISSSRNLFFGFVVASSARSLVRNSSGSNNIAPEGDGMGLFDAHNVRVLHNSFRRNPGPGIHVAGSTDNLIKGNLFSRNAPSILIEANRNQVRRNRVIRGGGIVVDPPGNRNVITGNRVSQALDSIAIENGRGNLVAHNFVRRARGEPGRLTGAGIRLGVGRPVSVGGAHNVVRRNLVIGSGDDGFLVNEKDHHSLLKRNVASGSGDDGFDIESSSATLTSNRALRNADLGIETVRGVIDGGGNIARHNGDPRECTNIVCR